MWRFSGIADRRFLLLHLEVGNGQDSAALSEFSTRSHSQKLLTCSSDTFVFSQSSSVHMSCPFSQGVLVPSSSSLPLCLAEPSVAVPQVSELSHPVPLFPKHPSSVTGRGAVHAVLPYSKICGNHSSFSAPHLQAMTVFLWGVLLGCKLPTRQIHLSYRIFGLSRSSMEKASYCCSRRN